MDDIKVVCGWCGRRLKGNPNARRVSHGICPECFDAEMEAAHQLETDAKIAAGGVWLNWRDLGGEG